MSERADTVDIVRSLVKEAVGFTPIDMDTDLVNGMNMDAFDIADLRTKIERVFNIDTSRICSPEGYCSIIEIADYILCTRR